MEVKKPGCPQKGERPPDRENVAVSPNPSWPSYPVHPRVSLALLAALIGSAFSAPAWPMARPS